MKTIYEFLLKNKTTTSTQATDYVDLGLPSGLLWAKCNIGAKEPTDYGDYFMWGSTKPNTNDICDWKQWPFNGGYDEFNRTYFDLIKDKIYENDTLKRENDAATVILGNEWRMPTKNDFEELFNNTDNKWVLNYNDSKKHGRLFMSKTHGAELFIPACGMRCVDETFSENVEMYMWTSTTVSNRYWAYCDVFNEWSSKINTAIYVDGLCIRGVQESH